MNSMGAAIEAACAAAAAEATIEKAMTVHCPTLERNVAFSKIMMSAYMESAEAASNHDQSWYYGRIELQLKAVKLLFIDMPSNDLDEFLCHVHAYLMDWYFSTMTSVASDKRNVPAIINGLLRVAKS
jgi:hypothetical protein